MIPSFPLPVHGSFSVSCLSSTWCFCGIVLVSVMWLFIVVLMNISPRVNEWCWAHFYVFFGPLSLENGLGPLPLDCLSIIECNLCVYSLDISSLLNIVCKHFILWFIFFTSHSLTHIFLVYTSFSSLIIAKFKEIKESVICCCIKTVGCHFYF